VEAGSDLDGKLGEVILASPAIDIAQFNAALDTLSARRQGRYTLYASSHDRALYTGYFREFGTNLAGFVSNGAPALHRGLDSIDVSEAGNIGDRLDYNHDIFATNSVVTEDMRQILQTGVRPPDKRLPNLVAKPGAGGVTFWTYKRAE
jgi:esterase/lipase superfamily enzyme